ncbi:MAG TPA: FadR/GntR family transcriptional regulator [Gammaproteobacteria bacterium]|nr:FadR/GntR family transcriptional regulator [Gammaproteobacteria bacterium]
MTTPFDKLEKIDRSRVSDVAADRLCEWISATGLAPGDKLPSEKTLMGRLGVGRSAVREACTKLKALGILETHQGKGTFVAQVPYELLLSHLRRFKDSTGDSMELLNHIWEMREIFEVSVASLAANRRTDEDLANLERAVQAMDKAIGNPGTGMGVEEDALFHHYLTRSAHNPVLDQLVEDIANLIQASRQHSLSRPGRPLSSNREHQKILAAVRRRDAAAAARLMREHLRNGKRLNQASLVKEG